METLSYATKTKAIKDHRCNFCCQPIVKGSIYHKSTHKFDGELYSWKTHPYCAAIASKLKMYDECDEGVSEDDFNEIIRNEYQEIMCKTQNEFYESKGFEYPKFSDQLDFVLTHHGITKSLTHE
jgi:hypothetical protein